MPHAVDEIACTSCCAPRLSVTRTCQNSVSWNVRCTNSPFADLDFYNSFCFDRHLDSNRRQFFNPEHPKFFFFIFFLLCPRRLNFDLYTNEFIVDVMRRYISFDQNKFPYLSFFFSRLIYVPRCPMNMWQSDSRLH